VAGNFLSKTGCTYRRKSLRYLSSLMSLMSAGRSLGLVWYWTRADSMRRTRKVMRSPYCSSIYMNSGWMGKYSLFSFGFIG
jgi:hypothetical protein